ncbi:uncharacterized protein LOC111080062 [Drosophila obscura]|uniref:uncharacterized protein LOC111080062 n=1 Tax=Drosophila obscura TaxID=7282 RepID=UPI001BB2903E|nr:uncharacterized protein LOC111080062 [Drosophila obscura]
MTKRSRDRGRGETCLSRLFSIDRPRDTDTDTGSDRWKWKWKENSNHKLGIYLRSVNDYHLKCARLPPKNQLLEKAQHRTNRAAKYRYSRKNYEIHV